MQWSKAVRVTHRWLTVALTLGILINGIAVFRGKYTNSVGALAAAPFALLFLSGVYLFFLPYFAKWRSARRRMNATDLSAVRH